MRHGERMTSLLIAVLTVLALPVLVQLLVDPHCTVDSWRRLLRDNDDELTR